MAAMTSSTRLKMRPEDAVAAPSSNPVARETSGGSNGKGHADIKQGEGFADRLKTAQAKYNNDGRYGYYGDDGKYVSFWQDATNGGGADTTGNYFKGGGAISAMLNAAKVRPSGAARARDDQGNYIVPRSDIGFRDINDWFDRGGPQASGGKFQGLGLYSALANLALGEKGQRTPYADQAAAAAQAVEALQNPVNWGVKPTPPANTPDNKTPPSVNQFGLSFPSGGQTKPYSKLTLDDMKQALVAYSPSLENTSDKYIKDAYDKYILGVDGYFYPEYHGSPTASTGMTHAFKPNESPVPTVQNPSLLGGTIPATGMTYGSASPEDMLRKKMRDAGYDPTGLGITELEEFVKFMGL